MIVVEIILVLEYIRTLVNSCVTKINLERRGTLSNELRWCKRNNVVIKEDIHENRAVFGAQLIIRMFPDLSKRVDSMNMKDV